jgi:hypothetical protein
MSEFKIDFFELMFLAEACIPPRPIARTMFWHKMIDVHYHNISQEERARAYDWIRRSIENRSESTKNHPDTILFLKRYNPNNQYLVETEYNGEKRKYETFKNGEWYYLSSRTSIAEEHIINVEKIFYEGNY